MKYFKILPILIVSSLLCFYSCNEDKKTQKQETVTAKEDLETTTEATKATPPLKEPAQNASGVWHYTCRLGCPGGAGLANKCATCGNILAHNTAYHANANTTTNSSPFATPQTSAATTTPEPAQNAAGVWHYTCAKGHAGGAGSAVACGTCGETLAHNTAYH
ncbi:hypothetical protein [Psychroserpens damuponensis]|uniref:hypothetical protein n=1 Tax=Psychroserpens damuponensis TaxID=943936 RepID=UPI0005908CE3|nr:hypothetical protein [Psychroserpens damuponensis]